MSASLYPSLKEGIDSLLADSLFPPSNIGIKIVSLSKNETLYQLNPAMLFNPASNEKLFTSAAALSILGEDFAFNTVVSIDSPSHTVFVKGHGDPLLSTSDIDSITTMIAPKISASVPWRIVGDLSYFDDLYLGEGWNWDYEPAAYAMYLTPLCVNLNCIKVRARPGQKSGDTLIVETQPKTDFVTIQNTGTTASDSAITPLQISRNWRERSNVITVKGEMPIKDSLSTTTLSVWQPERYALTLFAERLRAIGITVDSVSIDTVRPPTVELFRYSHRLDSVVTFLNKVSDNLSGEMLLKTLAAEKRGVPGTAEKGASVVFQFLSSIGIDTTKIIMVDGSGLSRHNLASADVVIQLLEAMYKNAEHFQAFYTSLPIAGVDGTIRSRMKDSLAQGNLRAKTGTLGAVSALSGYVRTVDNEMLAFSLLMQNFAGRARPYQRVQDQIGIYLSRMKRSEL